VDCSPATRIVPAAGMIATARVISRRSHGLLHARY
jgi:hypothetical protein